MQTPEPLPRFRSTQPSRAARPAPRAVAGDWGERMAWVAGLVLAVSAFTDWYTGSLPDGLTLSVSGWHTGPLGKLVFFIGLVTLILEALRGAGIELPATVPESLVLLGLGSIATIFVLIRLLSVPDTYFAQTSRGIGLWISLLAAIGLITAGLFRTTEDFH